MEPNANTTPAVSKETLWYLDNYIVLRDYYDRTISRIAARCVRMGNIAMEEYPFYRYILDVLEEISETGEFILEHKELYPYVEKKIAGGVEALKKNLQAFVSDEIFNRMESGSAYLSPAYGGDALTMIEENPDLDYVIPKEGSNMYVDSMCIVKNSANKEAAEKYINFMCRKDIARLNHDEIWYSTPHQQVYDELDEETKNELISYPPDDILEKTQVYTDLSPETLDLYTDLWIEIKKS